MTWTIKQTYIRLLLEAHAASEDEDRFDLMKDKPANVQLYERLRERNVLASIALINYISHNANYLTDILTHEFIGKPPKEYK
jgi:hypothetical protein